MKNTEQCVEFDEWDGWFVAREPERWSWADSVTALYWLLIVAGVAAWAGAMVGFLAGL